jgi:hypothetical protein
MQFLNRIFALLSLASQIHPSTDLLEASQNALPHEGIVKKSAGFVYVDLDDAYIHSLIPFIQKEGFIEPPYFSNPDSVGAHISIIYPDEMEQYGLSEIPECGQIIHFDPVECKVVHPPRWKEIDEVYFIVVDAPQLDAIRARYGLPKREFAYHITIGVKPLVIQ